MSWIKLFPKTRAFHRFVQLDLAVAYQNKKSSLDIQILYNDLLNEYKKNIPEKQLFIFSPKQGWSPICNFLDKPIPSASFPVKGVKKTLAVGNLGILLSSINNNLIGILIYLSVLIGIFIYLLFFLFVSNHD